MTNTLKNWRKNLFVQSKEPRCDHRTKNAKLCTENLEYCTENLKHYTENLKCGTEKLKHYTD